VSMEKVSSLQGKLGRGGENCAMGDRFFVALEIRAEISKISPFHYQSNEHRAVRSLFGTAG